MFVDSGDPEQVAGEFGRQSLYKMLGYFSLVGLLRLHSLLGDFYQALKVIENMNFNKKVSILLASHRFKLSCSSLWSIIIILLPVSSSTYKSTPVLSWLRRNGSTC